MLSTTSNCIYYVRVYYFDGDVALARPRTFEPATQRRAAVSDRGYRSPPDGYLLIVAAPTMQAASSCDPEPPEQPIAPISLPSSTSGMPPREAMTSSSVS